MEETEAATVCRCHCCTTFGPEAMTTYYCELVQKMFTVLASKAPVEPSFHDGVAVVLGRPVVQKLFTCSTLLTVLIRNVLLLCFIDTSQVNILQALDLPRKKQNKTKQNQFVLECT